VVESSAIVNAIEMISFNEVISLEFAKDFTHLTRESRKSCG